MMLLSLGEFLWSLLVLFFMVIYFMMLFYVIVDVFRRHDASGGKKALWLVFLLVAPLVGLLAYMITNSDGMAARNVNAGPAAAGSVRQLRPSHRRWWLGRRDREGQEPARFRRDHPGRVQRTKGEGACRLAGIVAHASAGMAGHADA